jgi:hypothetical protein
MNLKECQVNIARFPVNHAELGILRQSPFLQSVMYCYSSMVIYTFFEKMENTEVVQI